MSLLRRIEALEATSGAQTTSSGLNEIWLIGVTPGRLPRVWRRLGEG